MPSDSSSPRLTPNQILVLVVLMAEARVLTNNELKELAGFSLTGTDNTKLEKLGLVTTDRSHRPFSHQLTSEGLGLVIRLHTTEPPKQGGSAARSIFTLLANLNRSLNRMHMTADEFFKQDGSAPAQAEAAAPPVLAETQTLIRAAYRDAAKTPGSWVGLADLRAKLAGIDRAAVDLALLAMLELPDVRIIPVANTKSLKQRDHDAALDVAGEANHTIAIGLPG